MKYALLIYGDEQFYGGLDKTSAMPELMAKHMAFSSGLGSRQIGGAGLQGTATATTVRTAEGSKTIHDGPFAETKEQLGGFYLIDVPDLDAAIAIAKQVPVLRDGAVEIRPLLNH
jgi:hypothetical protein